MSVHIDCEVSKNCWNLTDSFGMICVNCGCCAKDKKTRYKNRIRTVEQWLEEKKNFDGWYEDDPEIKMIQKENVSADIRTFKRMLRYYRKKLTELT